MSPTSDRPMPGGEFALAGTTVARMGYGAMQLEKLSAHPDAAASVLQSALDAGVNHLDTAEFYGAGFVNDVIGRVVGDRDDVVIATKVGATTDSDGPLPLRAAQRPEELRASVEDNLRSLHRDHLDLVYLRRLDVGPGLSAEGDQAVPLDDQLDVMTSLRDAGMIGAIGLSAITTDTLRRALPVGIAAVQNAYSLVERYFEDMLRLTLAEGIAWVPFFPLGGGFPRYPKVTEQPAVRAAAERLDASPAQVGLAWLLQRTPNTLIIPGTSHAAHLAENLATVDVALDPTTLAELDDLVPVGGTGIEWVPRSA